MPTYEYECQKCGHHFEVFQSMNDDRLTKCPEKRCRGKVERLLGTGAGIIFKGGGFYETDYRSESYKAGEKKAAEGRKASSGSESKSGKSESGSSKPSKGSGKGKKGKDA